jgi:hypothetical protein
MKHGIHTLTHPLLVLDVFRVLKAQCIAVLMPMLILIRPWLPNAI